MLTLSRCVLLGAAVMQAKRKLKLIGSTAKRVVRTRQQHTLYMYGDWMRMKMQLYLGKKDEGGRLMAEASRDFCPPSQSSLVNRS